MQRFIFLQASILLSEKKKSLIPLFNAYFLLSASQ